MKSIIKNRFMLLIFVFSFLSVFSFSLGVNKVSAAGECETNTWDPTSASVVWKNVASAVKTQTFNLTHTYKDGFLPGAPSYTEEASCTAAGTNGATCQAGGVTRSTLGPEDPTLGFPCNPGTLYNVTSPKNKVDLDLPVCGTWSGTGPTYTLSNSTDATSGISIAGGSCTASSGSSCTVTISDIAGNTRACTSPVYSATTYTVNATLSGVGGSVTSTNPQTNITANSTTTFTLTPSSSSYVVNKDAVTKDSTNCQLGNPATAWSGNTYTTGTINANCTYTFTFTSTGTAPATPTGLTATAGACGSGTINVSWTASSGATSYTLRDGTTVIYTGAGTSFSHTGLIAGSSHSYSVLATNSVGSSAYSTSVSRTAPAVCVSSDACGNASSSTPRLTEPTTNPTACNPGVYANSPADTTTVGLQAWNWSCGTVTSCSAPKYGCRITTDSNYSLPQYGATGPNNNYGCAGTCANGGTDYSTCTPPPGMSGTLSTPNCTIASGASTCTVTVSWNVSDPTTVLGSSVTSSYPSAGTTISPPVSSGTADVGAKTNVVIPYSFRTFYLYNTGTQLATSTASATCASGTAWNGTLCAPAMTGTLTASNCTIASGASTCNSSLTWTTTNPVATSAVTTPTNITAGSGNNGSTTYGVSSGNRTFYLYNNAQLLAQATATATCISGTTWDGTKCAVNTPPPSSAPIITIWASPTTGMVNIVNPTILWSVANSPTSCTASGDWAGNRAYSGAQSQGVLNQIKTYTYTLTCTNANGSGNASATVLVSGVASGVNISVNPTSIYAGDGAQLTWSGPGTCTGTNFNAAGPNPQTVTPVTTTTYTVTCGGVSNQATLTVKKKPIFIED